MPGWLDRLLGREAPAQAEAKTRPAPVAATQQSGPLKPLDVAMIQARLRSLDVYENIEPRYHRDLDRVILEHCREQHDEPWWGPLHAFAVGARHDRTLHLPFVSLPVRFATQRGLKDCIISIENYLAFRSLQVADVTYGDGGALDLVDPVQDGIYRVVLRVADKGSDVSVRVVAETLQVEGIVAALNTRFREWRWGERMLLLSEHHGARGVIYCHVAKAERAHTTGWGKLEYLV